MIRDNYDLKWFGSTVEDAECKKTNFLKEIVVKILRKKGKMANRFPGIYGLAHKDLYTKVIKIGNEIDQSVFSFVPQQFYFPAEKDKFLDYHKTCEKGTIFIAKPVASSEGNSILLFKE